MPRTVFDIFSDFKFFYALISMFSKFKRNCHYIKSSFCDLKMTVRTLAPSAQKIVRHLKVQK